MQVSAPWLYFITLACIVANAIGQLLFKYSAEVANKQQSTISIEGLTIIGGALGLYLIAAIGWTFVLRSFDVSHVYPLMALAFILVPIGGMFFFDEQLDTLYFFGSVLIMVGIAICLKSSG